MASPEETAKSEYENKTTPATTATVAAAAKGSLHPQVRDDSRSSKNNDNDEEESTDEGGEGGDEDEDNNEDEETEGDEDGGDEEGGEEEDEIGNSGKAIAGHGKKSPTSNASKIPVASISVAVACLVGICAFLIYLGKKRKRERVRAAWVESVFGANGGSIR
ncbi:hypothetical protein BGX24_012088 [Mortierella sp. AD032]|nr:hypothetical protein BGX24_012088 [Mortierella sp. AD032]